MSAYQLHDSAGHFVSRARTLEAAHRASRRRNRAGSMVLNCTHGTKNRAHADEFVVRARPPSYWLNEPRAIKPFEIVMLLRVDDPEATEKIRGAIVKRMGSDWRAFVDGMVDVNRVGGELFDRFVIDQEHGKVMLARYQAPRQADRAWSAYARAGRDANMAKLSSRGRRELVRLSKASETPDSSLTTSERVTVALMSDGNILEKRDVRWKDGGKHAYGWTVKGKIKPGLSVADFARIYERRGFVAEGVGTSASEQVVRTEAKAAGEKKARVKRQTKAQQVAAEKARRKAIEDGPGFYVTNVYVAPSMMSQVHRSTRAAELGPFATLDEALPHAWKRLQEFMDMKFTYLLPVQVVESSSRDEAMQGGGYVWWTDGRRKGAPVPVEQARFANMRRSAS